LPDDARPAGGFAPGANPSRTSEAAPIPAARMNWRRLVSPDGFADALMVSPFVCPQNVI